MCVCVCVRRNYGFLSSQKYVQNSILRGIYITQQQLGAQIMEFILKIMFYLKIILREQINYEL